MNKKIKLSKAQAKVIKAMQEGIICHYMNGLNARCFLARDVKNISWSTIYKLEKLDLVKRFHNRVELTSQGKNYSIK